MLNKKLTDSEIANIIKSYEEKILSNGLKSLEPFEARDIVRQLQEEINRLKEDNRRLQDCIDEQDIEISRLYKRIDETKSEAYKEFWSKLKSHSRKMQSSDFSGEFWDKAVLVEDGDNLLKGMVNNYGNDDSTTNN